MFILTLGILFILYLVQLGFIIFFVCKDIFDDDSNYTQKRHILRDMIPYYWVYHIYKELRNDVVNHFKKLK